MILYTACGNEFQIDEDDLKLVEGHTFSMRGEYVGTWDGTHRWYLHKLIMPSNQEVDHINTDKMDNRRDNLRYTTHSINMQNRHGWGEYPKGVTYDQNKDLFRARIQINGKRIGLGRYKLLEDAVKAYNAAAIEHYGPDAMLSGGESE